jgi:hypothetical protein
MTAATTPSAVAAAIAAAIAEEPPAPDGGAPRLRVVSVLMGGLGNMILQAMHGVHLGTVHGRDVAMFVGPGFATQGALPLLAPLPRVAELPTTVLPQAGWTPSEDAANAARVGAATTDVAVQGYYAAGGFSSDAAAAHVHSTLAWSACAARAVHTLMAAAVPPATVEAMVSDAPAAVIALHIRRGDYLTLPHFHPTQSAAYYKAALAAMPADVPILVLSDDLPWARAQPWLCSARTHVWFPPLGTEETLWAMTRCGFHVIANSTLSWCGARFAAVVAAAGGRSAPRVAAPARWFGPGYAHHDTRCMYEPGWIVVDA